MLYPGLFVYLLFWLILGWRIKYLFGTGLFASFLSIFFFWLVMVLFTGILLYILKVTNPESENIINDLENLKGQGVLVIIIIIGGTALLLMALLIGVKDGYFYGFIAPVTLTHLFMALKIDKGRGEGPSGENEEEIKVEIPEESIIEGDFNLQFSWEYHNQLYEILLPIRRSVYEEYKQKERNLSVSEWAKCYVTDGICAEIRELSYRLIKYTKDSDHDEEVDFILSFIQSVIEYTPDLNSQGELIEYPKYPIETLVEKKGDCEDFSFLGGAILKSMGYKVALLELPRHIALGICGVAKGFYVEKDGERFYYREMTASGWSTGEVPSNFVNETVEVHIIPDITINS